jgi:hypothetical protein
MPIELSDLTFTEQDDIIPESWPAVILNTNTANTLAGNDRIVGSNDNYYYGHLGYGLKNVGVLNTSDGNDVIGGLTFEGAPIGSNYGFINEGTLNAGEGNDEIFGSGTFIRSGIYNGIYNSGTLNAGEGDDIITGSSGQYGGDYGFINEGTLNTEDGNDIITVFGQSIGFLNEGGTLNTGEGNDTITAYSSIGSGIVNYFGGAINTGNGEDSIISNAFSNNDGVFLEGGDDSIILNGFFSYSELALYNSNTIETGDGNDTITSSIAGIDNYGIINTGNGDDSIIVEGGSYESGTTYGIKNYGGAINMGDGNDSIIANAGFESDPNSSGAWFLGEGEDYIKGFGNGDFYGGNGNDTLELTPGSYTVGIWGEGNTSVIFTKGNSLMITSEFEQLIAGGTTYNFTSLTAGQTIVVAG